MTLFRIELAFDGEPQDVGLFNGVDEALSDAAAERHHLVFRQLLHIPDVPPQTKPYKFWFKPAGLYRCRDALLRALTDLAEHNWTFLVRAVNLDEAAAADAACYRDQYQMALFDEAVEAAAHSTPREIADVRDFELVLDPFFRDSFNRDFGPEAGICPSCGTFFSERPAKSRVDGTEICPDCGMREALAECGCDAGQQAEIVRIAWETRRNART